MLVASLVKLAPLSPPARGVGQQAEAAKKPSVLPDGLRVLPDVIVSGQQPASLV